MAKKSVDELAGDNQEESPKFNKLKKFIFGDENERVAPSGVLEHMDAYTGAPTRSAIAALQNDVTDLPAAAKAAYAQFGASPKTAPTGQDLAKNTGLTGMPATIAGMGLEMAADPSGLVTSGLKAAALPLFALRGLKGLDTAGDVARAVRGTEIAAETVKGLDTASDAAKAINAGEEALKLSKIPASFAEATKLNTAAKLAEEAKIAEKLAMENKMQKLLAQTDIPAEQLVNQIPSRPAFIGPGGVVNAANAAEGVALARTVPSEFGRVVQLPSIIDSRKAARLSKKPFESMGKVFRQKK